MTKVFKLDDYRGQEPQQPQPSRLQSRAVAVARFLKALSLRVLTFLLSSLRLATYVVLTITRGPVTFLLKLAAGLLIIASVVVFAGYSHEPAQQSYYLTRTLLGAFGAGVICYLYDVAIYHLNPLRAQPTRLTAGSDAA